MTINKPTFSLIIPCLNEESSIKLVIKNALLAFAELNISGEILAINDGSTDATKKIILDLSQIFPNVRLINNTKNIGIGASFWRGVENAHGEYVLLMPGDNEVNAYDALRYHALIKQVDIIVPFFMNTEVRSWARRVISSLYRFIINISFGTNLNYTNGCVIYNINVLKTVRLTTGGFLYQTELLVKLIRAGYLYAETPHFVAPRIGGKSKALSLKSLINVMKSYLYLIWQIHIVRSYKGVGSKPISTSASYERYREFNK